MSLIRKTTYILWYDRMELMRWLTRWRLTLATWSCSSIYKTSTLLLILRLHSRICHFVSKLCDFLSQIKLRFFWPIFFYKYWCRFDVNSTFDFVPNQAKNRQKKNLVEMTQFYSRGWGNITSVLSRGARQWRCYVPHRFSRFSSDQGYLGGASTL